MQRKLKFQAIKRLHLAHVPVQLLNKFFLAFPLGVWNELMPIGAHASIIDRNKGSAATATHIRRRLMHSSGPGLMCFTVKSGPARQRPGKSQAKSPRWWRCRAAELLLWSEPVHWGSRAHCPRLVNKSAAGVSSRIRTYGGASGGSRIATGVGCCAAWGVDVAWAHKGYKEQYPSTSRSRAPHEMA